MNKVTVKKIVISVVCFMAFIVIISSSGVISTGERGVKTRLGVVSGELNPGVYFKTPFIEGVDTFDVQTQKEQIDASAASADLQTVNTTVAINYNIDSSKVTDLYTRIGDDYKSKVIDPAIQEAVKASVASSTAEELITKRAQVTDKIESALASKLSLSDIQVTSVSIINFDFSPSFNAAIEAKVTAQQNALAAQNKLVQTEAEASSTIIQKTADAEAIKIQAQAINSQGGADYVQLQAIQKWDGHLPSQMIPGSSLPFINLTK